MQREFVSSIKLLMMSCLLAFALAGCGQIIREVPTLTPTVKLQPTSTAASVSMDATATAIPADWQTLSPGLEIRRLEVAEKLLLIVRVNLAQIALKVHYYPQSPKTVTGWQAALPDALVVANAGFFEPDNTTSGLLILDGVAVGESFDPATRYLEHSGMLTVRGEQAEIHLLADCPPSKCTHSEYALALTIALALLIFPLTLSHYAVLLVAVLLMIWVNRAEIGLQPGIIIAFITSVYVLMSIETFTIFVALLLTWLFCAGVCARLIWFNNPASHQTQ